MRRRRRSPSRTRTAQAPFLRSAPQCCRCVMASFKNGCELSRVSTGVAVPLTG